MILRLTLRVRTLSIPKKWISSCFSERTFSGYFAPQVGGAGVLVGSAVGATLTWGDTPAADTPTLTADVNTLAELKTYEFKKLWLLGIVGQRYGGQLRRKLDSNAKKLLTIFLDSTLWMASTRSFEQPVQNPGWIAQFYEIYLCNIVVLNLSPSYLPSNTVCPLIRTCLTSPVSELRTGISRGMATDDGIPAIYKLPRGTGVGRSGWTSRDKGSSLMPLVCILPNNKKEILNCSFKRSSERTQAHVSFHRTTLYDHVM